jgi:hypothetical protein
MSATGRNWTASVYTGLYCVGVIMTLACVAITFAGNTGPMYRFEHSGFPLSWAAGCVAILFFLAAESCEGLNPPETQSETHYLDLSVELEEIQA